MHEESTAMQASRQVTMFYWEARTIDADYGLS
jgi:hypothetical protein